MTEESSAETAGISRARLTRLETGKQDPTRTTLSSLAKALEVTAGKVVE